MGHTKGYRSGTRYMFSKKFRHHGPIALTKYLTNYKVGDIVDIKGDGSIHKGMPHKIYHGKTGTVFNVSKHALGVVVNKQHRHRIIPKRINVRIEHVHQSQCRQDFLDRVKQNEVKKAEAKKTGEKISCKRLPKQPTPGHFVLKTECTLLRPIKFEFLQ